eukprot:1741851-Rhodomonas_salina.1
MLAQYRTHPIARNCAIHQSTSLDPPPPPRVRKTLVLAPRTPHVPLAPGSTMRYVSGGNRVAPYAISVSTADHIHARRADSAPASRFRAFSAPLQSSPSWGFATRHCRQIWGDLVKGHRIATFALLRHTHRQYRIKRTCCVVVQHSDRPLKVTGNSIP